MKKEVIIITLFFAAFSLRMQAQTFNEWFRQNKTQLKYLGQQIAALEAYASAVEKGYAIIKTGTGIIGNIKRGDLSLHSSYFASLMSVKPGVLAYTGTLNAQWARDQVYRLATSTKAEAGVSGVFSAAELQKIQTFYAALITATDETWAALSAVNSDGNFQMTDGQRIDRSEALAPTLSEQYRAALTYSQAVHGICRGRLQELFDVMTGANLINGK